MSQTSVAAVRTIEFVTQPIHLALGDVSIDSAQFFKYSARASWKFTYNSTGADDEKKTT
jgi:hypothetical protein